MFACLWLFHLVVPAEVRESDRPTFVTDIQSVAADVGDRATFKAQVTGNPRPTVKWSVKPIFSCKTAAQNLC